MKTIIKAYEIEENLTWTYIGDGHMNKAWVGALGNKKLYFLKKYRTKDLNIILEEHYLLSKLDSTLEITVPIPIVTKVGSTVAIEDGSYYSLFHYMEGRKLSSPNRKEVVHLAETLAEIHLSLSKIENKGIKEETLKVDKKIMFQVNAFNVVDFRACERMVSDLEKAYHHSKHILIHGDYSFDNVFFNPVKCDIEVVYDWEESQYAYPLYDALTSYHFIGLKAPGLARVFIDTYFECLIDTELNMILESKEDFLKFLLSFHYYELAKMIACDEDLDYIEQVYLWMMDVYDKIRDKT
ncbi:hypothetical protein EZV73_27675 [Acidaminobacter sp. JC074]|uniref:phosphotransferase enzyme family protein n=1 Tax=Acidaminobacter sp. JC074 TaxID=2530199 RepID=UPI001F105035|nr:phosphotransferase [Acidaminobacter sp. JC074]MCH4891382.1 hypothetical protein [Acidaminobacter sp. JC074]